jgi:hypothetical protein
MAKKKKRRLTEEEIEEVKLWMHNSPQGRKPNIRQIAKRYGVNQPSVVKSLGGWKGIKRGRPEPPEKSELDKILEEGVGTNIFELNDKGEFQL